MIRKRNQALSVIFVLAACLISASITAVLITRRDNCRQFETIGRIIQGIMEEAPEDKESILRVLKNYKEQAGRQDAVSDTYENRNKEHKTGQSDENILVYYGYTSSDFLTSDTQAQYIFLAGIGCTAGIALILFAFWYWRRSSAGRIHALTEYLSGVNCNSKGMLLQNQEDDFSRLQDEMYKTVTMLNQTRDAAVKAKERFAENLANIAHQLKTPITALSLSVQMIENENGAGNCVEIENETEKRIRAEKYLDQMKRQIARLSYLEEALLLLARIDAGTLSLKREPVDVFTALTLAADNMEEALWQAGVSVDISEMGEAEMMGDIEWTMEALMNLLKNCMEHTPEGGTVHCSYEQNPLYVEIRIWDEGEGFVREDLPHIFERFYRGRNAKGSGIGIGLAFAKELIEMQNGVVSVENIKGGGACYDIRFYSH